MWFELVILILWVCVGYKCLQCLGRASNKQKSFGCRMSLWILSFWNLDKIRHFLDEVANLYYHLHISTSKELATLSALVKVRRVVSPDLKKGQMVTLVSASTGRGVRMTFLVQNICLFPARRPFPAMKWPKLAFCEQEMSIVHGFVGKRGASWQEIGKYFRPRVSSCRISWLVPMPGTTFDHIWMYIQGRAHNFFLLWQELSK